MFAYLDPGSGSIIATALVGGFASIAVAFRVLRARVTGVFRRGKDDVADEGTGEEAPEVASQDEAVEAEAEADSLSPATK